MFENFSERSRELVRLAEEAAHSFKSEFVGTEHVLVAILQQENTMAAEILVSLEVERDRVRSEILKLCASDPESHGPPALGKTVFSAACDRVFYAAVKFSLAFKESEVSPEHVLLGLRFEKNCIAAHILGTLGVGIDDVGRQVANRKRRGESPPPSTAP